MDENMVEKDLNSSKIGILLLSHGSKLQQSEEVINSYLQMYKEAYPKAIVEYGFMEIRQPSIPKAINKLTEGNDLEKIIVVPIFIAHGLHTKRDIPNILGIKSDFKEEHKHHHQHHHHHDHDHSHEEEKINFNGKIILTDPLGVDSRIFEIIEDRVLENLDQ